MPDREGAADGSQALSRVHRLASTDSNKIEAVETDDGSTLWQGRQRLEEKIEGLLVKLRQGRHKKDFGGYIETVTLEAFDDGETPQRE